MTRIDLAYLASNTFSALGNSLTAVVLPLLILQSSGSVISAGLVALATGLPQFLAAAAGGVLLDRCDRRAVAVAGDALSALSVAALPIVHATVGLDLGWFVAFGVLSALGDVPAMTARETMVPALARGTGTDQGILVGAREALACGAVILGPALAGGLVTLATSPVAALTVTATMSALAGAATLALPAWAGKTAGSAAPGSHSRLLADFREGVHHLFAEHRTLRALTLLSVGSLAAVAAIQGLVLPAYFAGIGRPGGAGLALSALAAGTMVGAAWPAASRGRVDARRAVLAGASMLVSGTWLLTALAGYASILTASVLIGAGTGTIAALTGTLSLTLARTDIQGRVLGNQNALTLGAAPVAALAVAGAIAAFDVRTGLAFVAVGLTGLAGWAALTPALGKRELAGDYATRRSGIVGDSGHHGGTRSPAMPGPTGR